MTITPDGATLTAAQLRELDVELRTATRALREARNALYRAGWILDKPMLEAFYQARDAHAVAMPTDTAMRLLELQTATGELSAYATIAEDCARQVNRRRAALLKAYEASLARQQKRTEAANK